MKIADAKEKAMKGAQKIIEQIPKAVEHSKLLQNTLTMIVEMQQQAKSIKKDAGEEVHKILEVLHHSYADMEKKAKKASDEAKKQAQGGLKNLMAKWEEKKDKLPKKFVGQMDSLLNQVGVTPKKAAAPKKATAKKATVAKKASAAKKSAATATKTKRVVKKGSPA